MQTIPKQTILADTSANSTGTWTYYPKNNGTVTSGTNTTLTSFKNDVRDGYLVPGWKKLIAEGQFVTTQCKRLVHEGKQGNETISFQHTVGDRSTYVNYDVLAWFFGALPMDNIGIIKHPVASKDVVDLAKQRCLANVDSTPYEFLEDVVEFKKTWDTLVSPLAQFYRKTTEWLSLTIKIYRKQRVSWLEAIERAWLLVRYGFRPIVYSINNAIRAISDWKSTPPGRKRCFGRETDMSTTSTAKSISYNNTLRFDGAEVVSTTVEARAVCFYETTNPTSAFENLGFRVKDIPSVYWAVMPSSFIIDWFLSISEFIKGSMNFLDPSVTILNGSVAVKTTYSLAITGAYTGLNGWTASGSCNGRFVTETNVTREPWMPTWFDTLPGVDVDLDSFKVLDLIAIAFSKLR